MIYESTRGEAPRLDFEAVLTTGLAADGGLYVPARWPRLPAAELEGLAGRRYADAAFRVVRPFVGDAVAPGTLAAILDDAYAAFGRDDAAPLVQIGDDAWLLELFHGPTLAFKDYALQVLGRLFDRVLERRGARAVVLGATSGDTGSAAIHACRGRANVDIFILHPRGRISDVQRRQMTTTGDANVHNIAVDGTFDDCQALVKTLFADPGLTQGLRLVAVNSINWARIAAQIVYYATAAAALGLPSRGVRFAVPTGNFGDVYAGYAAHRMGVPIAGLVVATNRNDILARCLNGGVYRPGGVRPTLSPSMDIEISSNFERLLYDLYDRDGAHIADLMRRLAADGGFAVDGARLAAARRLFRAARVDEDETLRTIARVHADTGIVVDPHTAVGIAAAARVPDGDGRPLVHLATAHPAKFPRAVTRAIGRPPPVPPALAGLADLPERCDALARDPRTIADYIRARAR